MSASHNRLKEKIAAGVPVLGTWNTMASPIASEVLARAGLDFVVLDFEHGPFDLGNTHQYVSACEQHGCSVITRVPAKQDWMVLQALDQGSHGVMVPHVNSADEAQAFVRSVKYHPRGMRGFSPFTKAGGFSTLRGRSHAAESNEATLSAIIIESLEGLSRIDDIVKIPDLDVIYFGAYDLSQALGVPQDTRNPKVVEAIAQAVAKVTAAGKCAGGFVATGRQDIEWLVSLGIRFLTYDVDTAILYRPVYETASWFQGRFR